LKVGGIFTEKLVLETRTRHLAETQFPTEEMGEVREDREKKEWGVHPHPHFFFVYLTYESGNQRERF